MNEQPIDARRPRRGITLAGWMWRIALIALGLLPVRAVMTAREAARMAQCSGNLSQLSLALANYESQYGTLPPAAVLGPDGKPWHSWRVLILPYLEQQGLYAAYRFDEPWDGPNNRLLIDQMPTSYRCPTDQARQGGPPRFSSVVAVVGPGTCFPPDRPASTFEFAGGRDRTLLLVELSRSEIPWTSPVDLDLATVLDQAGRGEGSPHARLRNVRFADFSGRALSVSLDAHDHRRLYPPAGSVSVVPAGASEDSSEARSVEVQEPPNELPNPRRPSSQDHPGVERSKDDHPAQR